MRVNVRVAIRKLVTPTQTTKTWPAFLGQALSATPAQEELVVDSISPASERIASFYNKAALNVRWKLVRVLVPPQRIAQHHCLIVGQTPSTDSPFAFQMTRIRMTDLFRTRTSV